MEILERHSVAIDTWSPLFPEDTTFLLSHVHTDHANIPKTFKQIIYASIATKTLFSHPAVESILLPGQWYQTRVTHLSFQVVDTLHTIDSIGFYFPSLGVLYLGDGIEPKIPCGRPLTVIYDALYEHIDCDAPSMVQTCALIQETLVNRCHVLQMVHHGILSFIVRCSPMVFRIHPSVPLLIQNTAKYLGMIDPDSPYLLVGRPYTDTQHIVPSSYWFMRDPSVDMHCVHEDGNKLRVFCSLHALRRDIENWQTRYPFVHFEALDTNPV
jgi:hypothetical protein